MKQQQIEKEVTLRELILRIGDFVREAIKYWYIIVLFCIVGGGIQYFRHIKMDANYIANLKFVVEGKEASGGGLSSLLGSFGVKKGGAISSFKIIEVAKSTEMMKKLLSARCDGGDLIANRIIDVYGLNAKWSEIEDTIITFSYKESLIDRDLEEYERKALKRLKSMIFPSDETSSMLMSINQNNDSGIFEITAKTSNEDLSLCLSNVLYSQVKTFFEDDVFQKQKDLVDILTQKTDSLTRLNESKFQELASFRYGFRGLTDEKIAIRESIIMNEQRSIAGALFEVMKNKEMSDVNMKDMQPLFLEIDKPFKPLNLKSPSLVLNLFLGLFIGGLLSVVFIFSRKIYRDIMTESQE